MKRARIGLALMLVLAAAAPARAHILSRFMNPASELEKINRSLKGRVIDFTFNHGIDRRIFSPALDEKRDLYVYVPPGFDPCQQYPLAIYMHGFGQDEHSFMQIVDQFDAAIVAGKLVPTILAAPDGSIRGRPSLLNAGSFYVNSRAGRFEDYVMQDVWDFLHARFQIRPEREAHALLGGSMGGFGAYNLGIKYRQNVAIIGGIFPPVNLRYLDCHGNFFGVFDPNCMGQREQLNPRAPVAKFYGGLVTIRERRLTDPLYGRNQEALSRIASENPIEMLTAYDVKPGELAMFIGYGGHDEFNINAQVESFVYLAKCRGLPVSTVLLPTGKHNMATGKKLIPYLLNWLAPRLASYGPCPCSPATPKP